ncbi:MAG: ribonuclease HI family protein [Candidatus Rokubacteria bacterium]|nr:ribonuclease HI family protein [Candidatus Rokubacteria bacterium]
MEPRKPRSPRGPAGRRHRALILHIDGSVEGNPGPGAIGVVVEGEDGTLVEAWGEAIGHVTNNQAEYRALLAGLEKARHLGAKAVTVRSDSQLLVRQLLGQYRVKDSKLKPLHEEARRLAGSFERFAIEHVRREANRAADRLANQARLNQP